MNHDVHTLALHAALPNAIFRTASRAVGGDIAGFACPDDRHEDVGGDGKNTAGRGNGRAFHENRGCISVEGEPPPEEGGRIVERPSGQIELRRTKLGLEAEANGYPLRCAPGHHHDNGEDNGNLPPEYSPSTHTGPNPQESRIRTENM